MIPRCCSDTLGKLKTLPGQAESDLVLPDPSQMVSGVAICAFWILATQLHAHAQRYIFVTSHVCLGRHRSGKFLAAVARKSFIGALSEAENSGAW